MNFKKITSKLISQNIIKKEDAPIYEYGLQCFFLYFINFLISAIIAIITDETLIYLLVVIFFFSLRKSAGGFHFQNPYVCMIFSQIVIIIPQLFLNRKILDIHVSIIVLLLLYMILWYLIIKNTQHHPNKYTNEIMIHRNKRKSIILLTVYFIIALVSIILKMHLITNTLLYSLSIQLISLFINIILSIDKNNKGCQTMNY